MTTGQKNNDAMVTADLLDSEQIGANIARIEALAQRLTVALARKEPHDLALDGPSAELYVKTALSYLNQLMHEPTKLFEDQLAEWQKAITQLGEAQNAFFKALTPDTSDPDAPPAPQDRRFSHPLWQNNPYFAWIKQNYQTYSQTVTEGLAKVEGLSALDRQRAEYFTQQILNLMAPSNFLATNPEALERALATNGESLVRGLENLVRDLEENSGELLVSLSDKSAFTLGENIATTAGSVIYRNEMIELIQYRPLTESQHQIPLLIFPPWINKFYILDLKPQNSLIKWALEQGFNVFVVSWVNPDASYAEVDMDTYIRDGFLRAIAETRRATGAAQVNAVGYCIAGTTLALTLAHLQKAADASVKTATFFTTLTDFADQGEFAVFLTDDFLNGLERQGARDGIISRLYLQRTFSYLRSNDLIYSPAIRSYLMGEAPPAFDLLYWNGDSTNLPAAMAAEYLRGLCQANQFAKGEFPVFGAPVSLSSVKQPVFAVACEGDHIANWQASFNGIKKMGSRSKTFVLSQSGHIAGIINPPSKGKYGHYTTSAPVKGEPLKWRESAQLQKGSWWPLWADWLAKHSGKKVTSIGPETELTPAPGSYVR